MAGETATATAAVAGAVAAVVAWDVVVELRRGRRLGHPRALTRLRTLTRFAPSEAEARARAARFPGVLRVTGSSPISAVEFRERFLTPEPEPPRRRGRPRKK